MVTVGAAAGATTPDVLLLRVAELGLLIDARGTGLGLTVPRGHAAFVVAQGEVSDAVRASGDLALRVLDGTPRVPAGARTAFVCDAWQLHRDASDRYVFDLPREVPPRLVTVTPDFTRGGVIMDLAAVGAAAVYLLQSADVLLYANWLGNSGDVILHASGVVKGGRGYCFCGVSGAGKSTLAAELATMPGVTVLGEDTVILRRIGGVFHIYGTPWHERPQFCSPLGAPLAKVFFLDRAMAPGARLISPADGVTRLLQTAYVPYYRRDAVTAILDRLAELAERVPFFELHHVLGADPSVLLV